MSLPVSSVAGLNPDTPSPRERLIVALDFPNGTAALATMERLDSLVQWFKIGLELYLYEGNKIVDAVKDRGYSVFLDLKLHDIPNTVSGAVRAVAATGADMLTLHSAGARDLKSRGLDDAHAWLPPEIAKRFGRRLEALGWLRDSAWTPYCRRLTET